MSQSSEFVARRLGEELGQLYLEADGSAKGSLTKLAYDAPYISSAELEQRLGRIRRGLESRRKLRIGVRVRQVNAWFEQALERVRYNPNLQGVVNMLQERGEEFRSEEAMKYAAIALLPEAREELDERMDRHWEGQTELPQEVGELIVGAGFHAAVYAAVRVAQGFPKPTVVERGRVGGTFASSSSPAFFLNSRNRPGRLGIPGQGDALNVLPGSPVQPADLSGDEYQRNSDLAFAIRVTLALNANVVTGVSLEEEGLQLQGGKQVLVSTDGDPIYADRIVDATGLGVEKKPKFKHERVLMFDDLMKRMDESFPLRGMKRVAVVGAGDSGKTAVEALLGKGPSQRMSVASLDYVEKIDWYGVPGEQFYRGDWVSCNRPRYQGIAAALPKTPADVENTRIRPRTDRAEQVAGGYDNVIVNGRPYDYVVWCAGFESLPADGDVLMANGRSVARRLAGFEDAFSIGPAASLAMDDMERAALPGDLPENAVALFRYADRTATLASLLPEAGVEIDTDDTDGPFRIEVS